MNDFITSLQFLTRIKVKEQQVWSPESFGRSVKYFPFVGAILGGLLWLVAMLFSIVPQWLMINGIAQSVWTLAVLALIMCLTGGLTCDGFMDSMDGLFSGRERERMLEIMKDSRVGANGVMTFVFLILAKWSVLQVLAPHQICAVLWVMPIVGRMAMVVAITCFSYAREDGIGKVFAVYAGRGTLTIALLSGFAFVALTGWPIVMASLLAIFISTGFAYWAARKLNGLTGDTYGACCELAEVSLLVVVLLLG